MFYNYFWLLCLCGTFRNCIADVEPLRGCPVEDVQDIREFNTLADYKSKSVTFDPHARGFKGNSIFFKNNIRRIPERSFVIDTSRALIEINLSNRAISEIEDGAFTSLICLQYLDLSHNELLLLRRNQFLDLGNLIMLNLTWNNIYRVNHFTFKYLPSLQTLDLSNNHIVKTENYAFNMLVNLQSLSVKGNRMKTFGGFFVFDHLTNLKHLDMSYNAFVVIYLNKFAALDSLETLNLAGNSVAIFEFLWLKTEFYNVRLLNLSWNFFNHNLNVKHLRKYFPNEELIVDINDNTFYCGNLETALQDLRKYKIKYAPGREFEFTHHREHIVCDVLNSSHNGYLDDYYDDLLKSLKTTTTEEPEIFRYKDILEAYSKDGTRHRQMLGTFITIMCVALLYNVLILVDYLLGYGYVKGICIRRQQERTEPAEEPEAFIPLQN